ncbi:hypothetical protein HU200_004477 [Digitaria exilis]|uniref:GDSL esterase/lipase n=1 Tax=Digitaria exilis TaxID=1010633 RepID=A0A835FSF4_9POAL|nr:hypothetical protein HU200_004477 [Digitaria exilis]
MGCPQLPTIFLPSLLKTPPLFFVLSHHTEDRGEEGSVGACLGYGDLTGAPGSPVVPGRRVGRYYNAIFSFGDSFSDTGNFVIINSGKLPTMPKFPPPYARCSNGRLVIDFLAEAFGIPLLPPSANKGTNFSQGANFAVMGATALDLKYFKDNNVWSIPPFNTSMNVAAPMVRRNQANHLLRPGRVPRLFGGNDYSFAWKAEWSLDKVKTMVPAVVASLVRGVERLLDEGARHVRRAGEPPRWVHPHHAHHVPVRGSKYNSVALYHNAMLRIALDKLQRRRPEARLVYADYYTPYIQFARTPHLYGYNSRERGEREAEECESTSVQNRDQAVTGGRLYGRWFPGQSQGWCRAAAAERESSGGDLSGVAVATAVCVACGEAVWSPSPARPWSLRLWLDWILRRDRRGALASRPFLLRCCWRWATARDLSLPIDRAGPAIVDGCVCQVRNIGVIDLNLLVPYTQPVSVRPVHSVAPSAPAAAAAVLQLQHERVVRPAPGRRRARTRTRNVSWDGIHLTEAPYRFIANTWLKGPYAHPPLATVVREDMDKSLRASRPRACVTKHTSSTKQRTYAATKGVGDDAMQAKPSFSIGAGPVGLAVVGQQLGNARAGGRSRRLGWGLGFAVRSRQPSREHPSRHVCAPAWAGWTDAPFGSLAPALNVFVPRIPANPRFTESQHACHVSVGSGSEISCRAIHLAFSCILWLRRKKVRKYTNIRLKQFSLLRHRHGPLVRSVPATEELNRPIVNCLVEHDRHRHPLTNGREAMYAEPQCHDDDPHACGSILHEKRTRATAVKKHRGVAVSLSQYCAYLVVFHPELLPDRRAMAELVLEDARSERRIELGRLFAIDLQEQDAPYDDRAVVRNGKRIGMELMGMWKIGEEQELLVYASPSNDEEHVNAHADMLPEGVEFITVLWAFTIHTGMSRRKRDHDLI